MPSVEDVKRDATVKVKSCGRILKELEFYQSEVDKTKEKLAEARRNVPSAGDKEEAEAKIKKIQELVVENEKMVPNARMRLQDAYMDLVAVLDTNKENVELEGVIKEALTQRDAVLQKVPDIGTASATAAA
eukprot:Trichotokara_eunicae@DN5252_c0_g1_i2.p1